MNEIVVLGEDRVQRMFAMAPKAFTRAMTHWLWRERKSFVGNKSHAGSFRRTLNRKKRKFYDGTWSQGMGRGFTGNINHPDRLDNMQLSMGIHDRWQQRIPYLEFLSRGGTITPKGKQWLMIPNYKNLRSVGLFGRIGGNAGNKNNWSKWRSQNQIRMGDFVPFHGKLLVFGDIPQEEMSGSHHNRHLSQLHRKLLFVGVKKATIRKQFDFIKAFERRIPGIIKRGENMANRTARDIDRGVSKGFTLVE